jgi:phytoene dehydrogenase-like protein
VLAASSLETVDYSQNRKVVVVGSGVGGLSVAARIASSNTQCQVTIIEKNLQVGGRCGSFETTIQNVGTFRHERGPSLLLLPDVYRDVFRDCSSLPAEDYGLTMSQCVPAYQVVFEDGDSITVGFPREGDSNNAALMSSEERKSRAIMDSYEHDGATKWDEYMRATSAFLDCGLPNFIEERLDLFSFPNFLIEALRDYAKVRTMCDVFRSHKSHAILCQQALIVLYFIVSLYATNLNGIIIGMAIKTTLRCPGRHFRIRKDEGSGILPRSLRWARTPSQQQAARWRCTQVDSARGVRIVGSD